MLTAIAGAAKEAAPDPKVAPVIHVVHAKPAPASPAVVAVLATILIAAHVISFDIKNNIRLYVPS